MSSPNARRVEGMVVGRPALYIALMPWGFKGVLDTYLGASSIIEIGPTLDYLEPQG